MNFLKVVKDSSVISLEINLLFYRKTVGILCYTEYDEYIQIDQFSVHKKFRRKGYGYKMISILKEIALKTPHIKWLQVFPRSEDTLTDELIDIRELNRIYERYGFQGNEAFVYDKNNQLMKMPIK